MSEKVSRVPCYSKLRGRLIKNRSQLLKVDGLDQVKIESGVLRTLHISLCAEAGECNCFDMTFRSRLCGYFVTTSIRQTDVTQHHVYVIRAHDLNCTFHVICSYNVVTKMGK